MFTSFHRISAASLLLLATALPSQAETLRWLTQTQSHNAQYPVEMAAIEAIGATGVTVERNEFQVLGLNLADSLTRRLRRVSAWHHTGRLRRERRSFPRRHRPDRRVHQHG